MIPCCFNFRPFNLRVEISSRTPFYDKDLDKALMADSCKDFHDYHMSYLQQFIDAYQEQPKFSYTWLSHLTHWGPNGLFAADRFFKKFFEDNLEKVGCRKGSKSDLGLKKRNF